MFQEAKWLGLSLALHLTVASSLLLVASRNVDRTPKAIMVVLDNLSLPEIPQHTTVRAPEAVARPQLPPKRPEPAKPEVMRQAPQPAAPQVQPAPAAPEQGRIRDLSKASPEVPAISNNRPRIETTSTVPISHTKTVVQPTAPQAEEWPAPEKAQQRYLKEHFAYIRDLITKHIAYPPMARKMGWSGKVVVAFIIAEDGTVHNIRVVETSGFTILDKSATETVRYAAPFPKPPVRAEIVVPVNFKML